MIPFFDSHAHLSSPQIWPDIDNVVGNAEKAGVNRIINICTDMDTLDKGMLLAQRHPWIYNAAATTPHDVEREGETFFPLVKQHAHAGKLAAIGETGLDYYYEHSAKEVQKHYLRKYLHLALDCKLPVIIHCRDAFADFFEILDAEYRCGDKHGPGVLHCFTGTVSEAEKVVKRGWYLSLSGIVTFKKSEELRNVAKIVPIEQLLIETDTPYLAPQRHRGKQNEPAYLKETARFIAELKEIPIETFARITAQNAKQLFNIPEKDA
jgi:TatD DNase family protein